MSDSSLPIPASRARRPLLLTAATLLLGTGIALQAARTRTLEDPVALDLGGPVASVSDEPAPDDEGAGQGTRHRGEEGKMGRSLGESSAPQESGHFLASPYGASAVGNDDEDVWGGLTGTEVGEAHGAGGLGLFGSGRGGGGTGEGEIGLGAHGIIGKGGGGGTGSGYGRGSGAGFGGRGHVWDAEPSGGTHALPPTRVADNGFVVVADDPMSTFSIDVDSASYANVRRALRERRLPDPQSVRIEEMVNYFEYDYAQPSEGEPFSVAAELGPCPWNPEHRLVHLGLQGKTVAQQDAPPRNLVFLIDVSGSMQGAGKLGLVQRGLAALTQHLDADDRVAIVVYAGSAGEVLEPTSGADKATIVEAIGRLRAGGSTNGGEGIQLAYRLAKRGFIEGGVNRVVLATDGDFNVGVSSHKKLVELVEAKRKTGVSLTVLGVGPASSDHTMEQLADKGDGNYAHLDSLAEARRVLVDELGATLQTIAKDVKIQVRFDPQHVRQFRLVGYENRMLAHRDFADDSKDAGEIGAGHSVTAMYEIVPRADAPAEGAPLSLSLRYKPPAGDTSELLGFSVPARAVDLDETTDDFRFAAAVASFGMLLRGSADRGQATYGSVRALAVDALGADRMCWRHELIDLVATAASLAGERGVAGMPGACRPGEVHDEDASDPERSTLRPQREIPIEVLQRPQAEAPEVASASEPPAPVIVSVIEADAAWQDVLFEALRIVPPLVALPLFVMAIRRPRRRGGASRQP